MIHGSKFRTPALFGFLIAANLAAWAAAFAAFGDRPVLFGTAILAYSFGLRHALDADHIAAIDNVTRKLMAEGKQAFTTGLWFSLGHSTVVVLASLIVALGASALSDGYEGYRETGGTIGTIVSALFLFAIAIANMFVLTGVWRVFRRVRNGGAYAEDDLDTLLSQRGFLGRLFRPLFALIGSSWQMYPLGFLFGLGFDTATEIGVLGISAAQGSQGLAVSSLLIFPALFTAGMALVDTADSVLMAGAYGWAFLKPIRKLYYNLTITFVSVLVALLVGGVEALGLFAEKLSLHGGIWDYVLMLNEEFGALGYAIVALFVVCWLISAAIYRIKGYDRLEAA
jgi:nickel/cobalt transporter (NiCoT) family protein